MAKKGRPEKPGQIKTSISLSKKAYTALGALKVCGYKGGNSKIIDTLLVDLAKREVFSRALKGEYEDLWE